MTTETMTIHKALCELKTIDARIYKEINSGPFVVANKHSNTKISGVDVSEFCEQIKSRMQSVNDMIKRRNAIKCAVVQSNAVTTVSVAGKEYTVAVAIDMKNNGMQYLKYWLQKMTTDYNKAQREANAANGDILEQRADDYIKTMYGNTDMKNASEEAKKSRAEFIAAQTYELVDPIKIVASMEEIEKHINQFMVEIDSALSVSNAVTTITIKY